MPELTHPYEKFAYAYDQMMTNVDYVRWANYIDAIFRKCAFLPRKILDLACGTGALTTLLARQNYEMWGIDRAEGMLAIARRKAEQQELKIQFRRGDMLGFNLRQRFDAVVCTYDSINYALSEEQLLNVFTCVSDHLKPSGLFIFDVTTERNITQHFHSQTFAENKENYSYIWKNMYSYRDKMCHTTLTFFIREGEFFRRFEEVHVQKMFEVNTVKKILGDSGYKMLGAYDMFTFNRWNRHSDRINFTAQKIETT
ncbi:MAG: class I SAM-dependent methyltransferase [Candidatus Poribacteria bacterium]|nr:class I SAM-dependent methyltransferase [Candidatus Poribacteria bacterium]MDE0506343.1 class I SAM-dependent methyltransferase [Candidatus Poribacteria bacterium]